MEKKRRPQKISAEFKLSVIRDYYSSGMSQYACVRKYHLFACRLFGCCCQAFYQSKADIESELRREHVILENACEIRKDDPGIGGYKLWVMRRLGLILPLRKARHTTNSNHRYLTIKTAQFLRMCLLIRYHYRGSVC